MKTDENILLEIYQRLYAEATPSGDFRAMIVSGKTKKDGFFMNYYLDQNRQNEIIEEVLKKYKVSRRQRRAFHIGVALGASPTTPKTNKTK